MFQFKNLLVTIFLMIFLVAAHSSEHDFDESCLECQRLSQRQPSKMMNHYDMNRPAFSCEVNQTVTYTPFYSNPNQPRASHKNPTPFRQQYNAPLQSDDFDVSCLECMRLYQQNSFNKNSIKQSSHPIYKRGSTASEINTNQSIYQGPSKRFDSLRSGTLSPFSQQNQFVPRAPLKNFESNNRAPLLPPFYQTNHAPLLKKREYEDPLLPPLQSIVPTLPRPCYEKETPPLPYCYPSPKNDPYDSLGVDSADELAVQIQTDVDLFFPTSKPKKKRWVVYEPTYFEAKQLNQLHKDLSDDYDDQYIDEGARILESNDSTIYVRPFKRRKVKIEPAPYPHNEQQQDFQPNVMNTSVVGQPPNLAYQNDPPPTQEQSLHSTQNMTQNNHPPMNSAQSTFQVLPQEHHRQSFSEESTDQTLSAMTGSPTAITANDEPLLGEEFSWPESDLLSTNSHFNLSMSSEYYDDLTELLQTKGDDYFG